MLEDRHSISISKEVLPSLEGFGFSETFLGDARGSLKQYRNSTGIHVREYKDRFVIHKDTFDPREDPIGHLLFDSPETLISFGVATLLTSNRNQKSQHEVSTPSSKESSSSSDFSFLKSPLGFLFLFLSLNSLLGWIKRLLF